MKENKFDEIKAEVRSLKESARFMFAKCDALFVELAKLKVQEKANADMAETFMATLESCPRCKAAGPKLFNIHYTDTVAKAYYICRECGVQTEVGQFRRIRTEV